MRSEQLSENNKTQSPEYVEDVPNKLIPADASLSDDELVQGGLTRVSGWMRTKSSKNAERQRRKRERDAAGEDGKKPVRQINLQAPNDDTTRDALKRVTKQLVDGDLSPSDLDVIGRLDTMRLGIDTHRILTAGGWKAAVMRRLLKAGH
jgi:hypothetical protein